MGIDGAMGSISAGITGFRRPGLGSLGIVHEVVGGPEVAIDPGIVPVADGFIHQPIGISPEVARVGVIQGGIVRKCINQHDAVEISIAIAVVISPRIAGICGKIPIRCGFNEGSGGFYVRRHGAGLESAFIPGRDGSRKG